MNCLPFLGHKEWEAVQNDVRAKKCGANVHLLAAADLGSNLCAKSNIVKDQLNV